MEFTTLHLWFDLPTILLTAIVFQVTYWLCNRFRTSNLVLPPGPRGLPLLGNLFALANATPFRTLHDMAVKYGDVFTIRLGRQLVVVLNSYDAIREAMVKKADDFTGRPVLPFKTGLGTPNDGVVFANGEAWKSKRRVILKNLRAFGMGKAMMERKILDESCHLLREFGNNQGIAFNPADMTSNAVFNVICSVIVGERFEYDDSRFKVCMEAIYSMLKIGHQYCGIGFLFPGTGSLISFINRKQNSLNQQAIIETVKPYVDQHSSTYDPENIRDFIDVFLKITKDKDVSYETSSLQSQGNGLLDHRYVYAMIRDIFGAGTDTIKTTLMWAWLYMLKYPDIQKKVQEELDRVVGKDRQPNMSDRVNLPYTEATITEVLRLACAVPLSVPHWTMQDTTLYGFDIPKDTMIWCNIWSAGRDPKLWKNPDEFDPTRYIDPNGKFRRPAIHIPFGLGPRACLGEQLAKMELFLIFTCVLANYTLQPDDEFPLPDLTGAMHINLTPLDYVMKAVKRG
ncbi:cytochrome P450 2F3-like [Glandiceps talaboti]